MAVYLFRLRSNLATSPTHRAK